MDDDECLYVGASKCIGRRLLHGHLAREWAIVNLGKGGLYYTFRVLRSEQDRLWFEKLAIGILRPPLNYTQPPYPRIYGVVPILGDCGSKLCISTLRGVYLDRFKGPVTRYSSIPCETVVYQPKSRICMEEDWGNIWPNHGGYASPSHSSHYTSLSYPEKFYYAPRPTTAPIQFELDLARALMRNTRRCPPELRLVHGYASTFQVVMESAVTALA